MRVLVCEFVTGGGLRGEDLPPSLAREGAMMRDALLRDLIHLPGAHIDVVTTCDDRLAPPLYLADASIAEGDDVWEIWPSIAHNCEAAWPIAPETGGLLSRLAETLRAEGNLVFGPSKDAIAIASSKLRTAEVLRVAGVPTPPVWRAGEAPAGLFGRFVLKPDDGAGCEGTRLCDQMPDTIPAGAVVQPHVAGEAASLTVLGDVGKAHLLTVNRQHVAIEDGAFRFRGLTVGAHDDPDGRFAAIAKAVSDAIPGLDDFFGIDLVLTPDGPVVIEVNPRVTTAYCGLAESIGFNPLVMMLPFATREPPATPRRRPVEVRL